MKNGNTLAILIWGLIFAIAIIITIITKIIKEHKFNKYNFNKYKFHKIFFKYKIINDEMYKNNFKYFGTNIKYFIHDNLYLTKYRIVQGYYTHTKQATFKIEFKYYFNWIEYTNEINDIEKAKEILTIIENEIETYFSKKHAFGKNKRVLEIFKCKY